MRDVVVIGAGPSGSITARRLAELGRDVLLLEEHEQIGQPVHCTGLLGADAFDEFHLPRHLVLGLAESARFWAASGQSVTVQGPRARATVINRGALDEWLARSAAANGVELRTGVRVERVDVATDEVRVTVRGEGDSIRARSCVLACGANYRFHRALGLGVPSCFLQSAQLEAAFPAIESPPVEVQFGREVAPAGFAWMVPLVRDGVAHARIGLMAETRSRQRFGTFLEALCRRSGADVTAMPPPRLKMLPLAPVAKTFAARVLAVGDAAGLVKPTTGGGIYYGLVSGALAAEVLDDGLGRDRLDEAFLRKYEVRWKKRLGQEIRVGLAFRRMAQDLGDDSINALIELARVNGIAQILQDTASFNWHRKAAIALLADASVRKIMFRSWRNAASAF